MLRNADAVISSAITCVPTGTGHLAVKCATFQPVAMPSAVNVPAVPVPVPTPKAGMDAVARNVATGNTRLIVNMRNVVHALVIRARKKMRKKTLPNDLHMINK